MNGKLRCLVAFLFVSLFVGAGSLYAQSVDFESFSAGDTLNAIGWSDTDIEAVVVDSSGNNVLQVSIHNYNAAPVLEMVLPDGKTLADYATFNFKGYFAQGDVGYKDIVVEAYSSMPTEPFADGNAEVELGSWSRSQMGSTAWEDITVDITNSSSLSDTVYIAFGINASGTGDVGGDGVTTQWYADDVMLEEATSTAGPEISQWGSISRHGWPVTEVTQSGATISGEEPPASWATLRGAFNDTLTATTSQAVVVTGKLEFSGGDPTGWSALRYGMFHHDSAGTLQYTGTDSVRWSGSESMADGYLFTPYSGTNEGVSWRYGEGYNATHGVVRNGSWISTNNWSGDAPVPMGEVLPAPRRAELTEGVYDFAISVQPTGNGTNELRWYLVKEDESYWFAGSSIDTLQITTKFNGVTFGLIDGVQTSSMTLSEVSAQLGDPVEIPSKPFSSFYVDQWGSMGGRTGWPILNDSTTIVGDASMGADGPPNGQWATLRGGFGSTVEATQEEAIRITGQMEIEGGDLTSWSPLRYGLFRHDSAGVLEGQYTDTAAWSGNETNAYGYMFTPRSGSNQHVGGNGGNGTQWRIEGGSWISSYSGPTMGIVNQAPRRAEMTAGTYDFAFSVQPTGNGTNEVRWYLMKEDESYWFGGSFIDSAQVTTEFNGVAFGINGGNGIGDTGVTGLNLIAVEVDKGSAIEVPNAPFSSFFVDQWGSMGGRTGWPILNDSTTLVGDGMMGADGPPNGQWATIRGGFGANVAATQDEAIIVSGEMEIEGGDLTSWSPLRYGLFRHDSAGVLEHQYTDSAAWSGNESDAYGYMFTPRSGANQHASGSGGNGTQWRIEGGSWISTYSGPSMGIVNQAPRRAEMTAGTYEFAFSVQPTGNGTNEVRWYLVKEDESYWFGGSFIDSTQITTEFNGVAFGINGGNGIGETGVTGLSVIGVEVERGDAITVPEAPFEGFYVSDWGFFGDRIGGWSMTPGEIVGNTTVSGDNPPDGWTAVRGDFGQSVTPGSEGEALVVTGNVTFEGGGFEDWSSFRFGMFHSDSTGSLDSTETSGFVWSGTEGSSDGYLALPLSGDAEMVDWQGIGESGTFGALMNGTWLSSNNDSAYVLSDAMPTPDGVAAPAGTYNFGISVRPLEDGQQEIKFKLEQEEGDYVFADSLVDDHSPLASTMFNNVSFATNSSSATSMSITDVYVDRTDPFIVNTAVEPDEGTELPRKFALQQNYPNPFNPTTKITYSVPKTSNVTIKIYNVTGRLVQTLVNETRNPGRYTVNFEAGNLSSGLYLYRMSAGSFSQVKRMMLIK